MPFPADARLIRFSGYDWIVKNGDQLGPGPNSWDENNVFVDGHGHLHLRLSSKNGKWHSAEVTTLQRFGFGRYVFIVEGYIDRMDHNVVLGLFNYPTADVGPNGTNEIDIEFTRFGNPGSRPGNLSVAPAANNLDVITRSFPFSLERGLSTHSFTWRPASILFSSSHGENLDEVHCDDPRNIVTGLYQPQDAEKQIPQQPMPVHMNLWSFRGLPPTDGKEVEVVIRAFHFHGLSDKDNHNPFGQIFSLCALKILTESRLPHAQYFSVLSR